MSGLLSADAEVGMLRVRGTADTPAVRLGIGAAVGSADLRPPALPPAAVLVVRRLDDPMPGRLTVHPSAVNRDPGWEGAVRDVLAERLRRAARPALGPVPADAEAVLFEDRAELVACLLADLLQGETAHRWWWTWIGPRAAAAGGLAAVMMTEAMVLPAAMQLLSRRHLAVPVVAALSASEADHVLTVVAAVHGAVDLGTTEPEPPPAVAHDLRDGEVETSRRAESVGTGGAASRRRFDPSRGSQVEPPWARWLPDAVVPSALAPAQRVLLGVVLLLDVRGAEVRRIEFGRAVRRWRRSVPGTSSSLGSRADQGSTWSRPNTRPRRAPPHAVEQRDVPAIDPAMTQSADEPHVRPVVQAAADSPDATVTPRTDRHADRSPLTAGRSAESSGPSEHGLAGVDTELAGVMFLVNILGRLSLPECFEPGWRLATRVGGWGTIEGIGRALVPGHPPWTADRIWTVLAELAGRPAAILPGRGVPRGADHWLPAEWPEPHPDRSPADLRPTAARDLGGGYRQWLELSIPSIRRSLSEELSVDERTIPSRLLVRHGRIFATRTHVDVVMGLDSVSVAVRRCGLDRDPGWVPVLGRVVTYHFE